VATAVALAFSGSVFAQATISNGSITAALDASGNFKSSTLDGSPGLNYLGTEYINWGSHSSWYWLTTTTPAGSFLAQFGTNPLGATTSLAPGSGGTAATTFAFGGLVVSMLHTLPQANQMATTITITNPLGGETSAPVTGVKWNVGLDPDQDIPGLGTFATENKIVGVGNNAAVRAASFTAPSLTLANSTGAGAFLVKAYINVDDCCSAVDGATALTFGQGLGFTNYGDDSISLGYDLGDIADGGTVSFGYTYTFTAPIPEPETYAMLLAGLGLMGFMARRRRKALAA
jgi:hypothetical protein